MASNYPAALDSLSNPDGGDALSTGHAAQHGNVNDAVEAIEGELGTDPAGASATVKARFEAIEANSWVTSARIADGTVTGTDIASGTVTSANLVDGTIVNADVSGTAAIDKTKISGTAVTVADTGTVTSAMIADGTIVNGDVNASAAIAATKISGTAVTQADSGTVTSTMIANGTITGTDIASGTVTSTNIADGTIVNADVATGAAIDVAKLTGVVTSAGVGNLLTANQASLESGVTTGWTGASATLLASTTYALAGTYSLEATATAATTQVYSPLIPVTVGMTYTFQVSVRSAVARTATVYIQWYTAAPALITQVVSTGIASSTSGWTSLRVTGVAPATATQAILRVFSEGNTAGDIHYYDCFSFHQGAAGLWSLPGTPIANLGTYTDESVGRRIFIWDTVNSRWQQTYGDTGVRDMIATYAPSNDWAVYNNAYLRRVGSTVECTLHLNGTSASADLVGAALIPSGFRPGKNQYFPAQSNGLNTRLGEVLTSGNVTIYSHAALIYYMQTTWLTLDAWPASLPGSASGSIPS